MNKYLVETVSIFRMRYVVEAKEATHARDEVVISLKDTDFNEFSQNHMDEIISSVREITDEEYLKIFDEDNSYIKDWTDEQKFQFVQKIDYDKYNTYEESDSSCKHTLVDAECCGLCNP